MLGSELSGFGQSGAQPLAGPNPYQPQNQPSCEARSSRTITAAPRVGKSLAGSAARQRLPGSGYISLTMMAPFGTGVGSAGRDPSTGRFVFSHSAISGE